MIVKGVRDITGIDVRFMFKRINRLRKQLFTKPEPFGLRFRCNICGNITSSEMSKLSREGASCHVCGSSVRLRAMIHILSVELFGESMPLPEFPHNKDMRGVGMSDSDEYAKPLADLLDYTNTYYHQDPMLDITNTSEDQVGTMDFIISSDVYEHVLFPVNRAFVNTAKLLKDNGVFVFTVPYTKEGEETVEHFGQLHDFEIEKNQGEYILKDTDEAGQVRAFDDLIFHGGPGSTLEMRVFCEKSLMKELSDAGFKNVKVYDEPYLKYGIDWGDVTWSLPIAARK